MLLNMDIFGSATNTTSSWQWIPMEGICLCIDIMVYRYMEMRDILMHLYAQGFSMRLR
jgi:hypothetical protein